MSEPLDILWGAAEIGKAIRRNVRQTYHLLESGAIPAAKINGTWVASKAEIGRALQRSIADGTETTRHKRDMGAKIGDLGNEING